MLGRTSDLEQYYFLEFDTRYTIYRYSRSFSFAITPIYALLFLFVTMVSPK